MCFGIVVRQKPFEFFSFSKNGILFLAGANTKEVKNCGKTIQELGEFVKCRKNYLNRK
jgi:hypothetical protein